MSSSFLLRTAFVFAAFPVLGAGATLPSAEAEQLFARRIKPLLQEKCIACHGREAEKIKGGLDLRTLKATLAGGDSLKPEIAAGKPEESPFYLAITRTHADWEAMPPKENDALTVTQIAEVKDWIVAGAPCPTTPACESCSPRKTSGPSPTASP